MIQDRVKPEPIPPFAGSKFRVDNQDKVSEHIAQVKAAVERYVAAQFGRVRLALRTFVLLMLFGSMVLIATAAFAVVAVVQICFGAAGGIGAFLGNRLWAGDLIVGVAIFRGHLPLFAGSPSPKFVSQPGKKRWSIICSPPHTRLRATENERFTQSFGNRNSFPPGKRGERVCDSCIRTGQGGTAKPGRCAPFCAKDPFCLSSVRPSPVF